MKKTESQQARKQRKWKAKAPLHIRHKMMAASLSKELKDKYKRNSLPVRKGDTVKVLRGSNRGHKGMIMSVDLKKYKVFIEGIILKKADGKDVIRPVSPSNLQITGLNDEDKIRREIIGMKKEEK
jgi:large subunit ribosomal protein L24